MTVDLLNSSDNSGAVNAATGCRSSWSLIQTLSGTRAFSILNLGRLTVHASKLPNTTAGFTLDRKCSSGLNAIALAARSIMCDEIDVAVAGGAESISMTLNKHAPAWRNRSQAVIAADPYAYMAMIETAEVVAERYGISREDQDAFSALSQQRAGAAQAAGRFDAEIVDITVEKSLKDKEGNETGRESVTVTADEGVRGDTTAEGLSGLRPVFKDGMVIKEGKHITAGNASQLSDGASAQVVMDLATAQKEADAILAVTGGHQQAAEPAAHHERALQGQRDLQPRRICRETLRAVPSIQFNRPLENYHRENPAVINSIAELHQAHSRRAFLGTTAGSLGLTALGSLLAEDAPGGAARSPGGTSGELDLALSKIAPKATARKRWVRK